MHITVQWQFTSSACIASRGAGTCPSKRGNRVARVPFSSSCFFEKIISDNTLKHIPVSRHFQLLPRLSHSVYLTSGILKFSSFYMKQQYGHFLQPMKGMVIKKGVVRCPTRESYLFALICFQHANIFLMCKYCQDNSGFPELLLNNCYSSKHIRGWLM